jgi:hypothetical protein
MAPKPGDLVEITNVHPDGDLRFFMPELALHAHVQLGERHSLFPLHLDQIGILAEERRVFLGYRVVFKYRMIPLERRQATLYPGSMPAELPESYVQAWED